MIMKKLTQKQYDFVNNYVNNGFNAAQAALSAGYSQKYADAQAYNLVNHPVIHEHLTHAYQKAEKNTEINFEWVINKYINIISVFEKSPLAQDARVVIAALAELSKIKGYYSPDKKLSLTIDTTKERLAEARRIYQEY